MITRSLSTVSETFATDYKPKIYVSFTQEIVGHNAVRARCGLTSHCIPRSVTNIIGRLLCAQVCFLCNRRKVTTTAYQLIIVSNSSKLIETLKQINMSGPQGTYELGGGRRGGISDQGGQGGQTGSK